MVRMIRALLCRILNRIGTVFIRKDALRLSLQIAILRPLNETNERTNKTTRFVNLFCLTLSKWQCHGFCLRHRRRAAPDHSMDIVDKVPRPLTAKGLKAFGALRELRVQVSDLLI